MKVKFLNLAFLCLLVAGCEKVSVPSSSDEQTDVELVSLEDVARLLSSVELGSDRICEVYDAVYSSSSNGYDEEYMLCDLLRSPGSGVGEDKLSEEVKSSMKGKSYRRPMKDIFSQWCDEKATAATKASDAQAKTLSAEDYMNYLQESGMQIYWPEHEKWDGTQAPVISFAPESESAATNIGYFMDGDGVMQEIVVDEAMASERPVWIINRNDDSPYVSLDVMKMNNPDWQSGGEIVINPTKSSSTKGKSLILKSFKMLQHYDSWFRGASEFFVKMGSVESFTASTEAELKLYNPQITDFMVVVRRKELNVDKELGVMLVSDWTEQLEDCAFMLIEDDGGTKTTWACSATVKIKSKSYGFDVSLPLNSRDDIVWRGKLGYRYLNSGETVKGRFGGVDITFGVKEY